MYMYPVALSGEIASVCPVFVQLDSVYPELDCPRFMRVLMSCSNAVFICVYVCVHVRKGIYL